MEFESIVKKIPRSLRETVADGLIDLILSSPKGAKLPSDLAKTILFYWQRDQLSSEVGLQRLLEAATILDVDKTVEVLEKAGLSEVAVALKTTIK